MSDYQHGNPDHDDHHEPDMVRDPEYGSPVCAECGESLRYIGDVFGYERDENANDPNGSWHPERECGY